MQDIGEQIASGEIRSAHLRAAHALRAFFGVDGRAGAAVVARRNVSVGPHRRMAARAEPAVSVRHRPRMEEQLGGRRFAGCTRSQRSAVPATYLALHAIERGDLGPWAPLAGATAGRAGRTRGGSVDRAERRGLGVVEWAHASAAHACDLGLRLRRADRHQARHRRLEAGARRRESRRGSSPPRCDAETARVTRRSEAARHF